MEDTWCALPIESVDLCDLVNLRSAEGSGKVGKVVRAAWRGAQKERYGRNGTEGAEYHGEYPRSRRQYSAHTAPPRAAPRFASRGQDGGEFRTGSGRADAASRVESRPSHAEEINSVLCYRRRYVRTDIQMVTSGILWNRREVPGRTALSMSCPVRCIELKAMKPTTNPAADYQLMYLLEVC